MTLFKTEDKIHLSDRHNKIVSDRHNTIVSDRHFYLIIFKYPYR